MSLQLKSQEEKSPESQQWKNQTYAFIDSQNLNISIQNKGWKLDWKLFRKYLEDKYQTTKAFLFIGYVPGNETMYSVLQQQGYILIFKPTIDSEAGVKGNIDVELTLRAMIEYPNYQSAVIVTGDGDFHALIDFLNSNNKLKSLIIPNKERYSGLFKRFESKIDYLSQRKKSLSYRSQNTNRPKSSNNPQK
jgi:uncharacterized LabA/DUF88 family protein